jgi:hypothetical protein
MGGATHIKIVALITLFAAIIFMIVVGHYTSYLFQKNKLMWTLLLSLTTILSLFLYGFDELEESK